MNTLFSRLLSDMPTFWRRVQKLAFFGLAVIAALKLEPELIPDGLQDYLKYAFVFFTTIAATAQFTCNDASSSQEDRPQDAR